MISQLLNHSVKNPDKTAFIFLEDGECMERRVTYSELQKSVSQVAYALSKKNLEGQRALLIYQDTIAFTISFLACQLTGIVAIPVYFAKGERQQNKLKNIISDSAPSIVLTTAKLEEYISQTLSVVNDNNKLEIFNTEVGANANTALLLTEESAEKLAFIQYTSGSTGTPKGVMISKNNLVANQKIIQQAFGCTEDTIGLSWLPFQHDMGLIGNILHSVYIGFTCVLMSPFHFTQKPQRWLEAITKYSVTHSGAPNFAYDLCVDKIQRDVFPSLDLTSWKVAFNGAEPVRHQTLQRFAHYFSDVGFRPASFFPCYGLAEATLMVSGYKKQTAPPLRLSREILHDTHSVQETLVSSGAVPDGMEVMIVNSETGIQCQEGEEGEIVVAGDSISQGYWNRNNNDLFIDRKGKRYFKTGDIGLFFKGELIVCGRLKEMLVIRGKNLYPYDVEQTVSETDVVIAAHGVAVFGIHTRQQEALVIVAEIKRTHIRSVNTTAVISSINRAVSILYGIEPHDILLVKPLVIPRTTSGKLQRLDCKTLYEKDEIEILDSKKRVESYVMHSHKKIFVDGVLERKDAHAIKEYLMYVLQTRIPDLTGLSSNQVSDIDALGLDSLKSMELINTINNDLDVAIDPKLIYQHHTFQSLADLIESMLWVKNGKTEGPEIVL
jgi:acyl-CoA synthetase (AMP-forming)/AMP-acid ligase II/acyl carrier protein